MNIVIEEFSEQRLLELTAIWNSVVEDGVAFPQDTPLGEDEAAVFFASQSFTAVAVDSDTGRAVGLYILHPNNVGRCGHIANASYAVDKNLRGKHIGRLLVTHCLEKAKTLGFRILQFNAVVAVNHGAIRLYEELGFTRLGVIPGGFRTDSGYEDIIPFYHTL